VVVVVVVVLDEIIFHNTKFPFILPHNSDYLNYAGNSSRGPTGKPTLQQPNPYWIKKN